MEVTTTITAILSVLLSKKRTRLSSRGVKFSKNSTKEATSIYKAELVLIPGKLKLEGQRSAPFMDTITRAPL